MPTSLLNPLLQIIFSYFVYLQTICACPRCGNAHILAQPLLAIIFLFSSSGHLCLPTMPTSLLNPLLQLFFSYFVYLQTICACPRCGNAHILAQPLLAIIFLFFSSGHLCLPTMWQCPHRGQAQIV